MTRNQRKATLMLALAAASTFSFGYEKDIHFNMTYTFCRLNGMTSKEALTVASADQQQDDNDTMVAGIANPPNYLWHSFADTQAKATQRLNELWTRSVTSKDLMKFGQYLHFAQDYFSHRNKHAADQLSPNWQPYGWKVGHGMDFHQPDRLPWNPALARECMKLTTQKIREYVTQVLKRPTGTYDLAKNNIMVDKITLIYTKDAVGLLDEAEQYKIQKAQKQALAEMQVPMPFFPGEALTLTYSSMMSILFDESGEPTIPYSLKVKTGDVADAGTDSNIYLKLFGTKGETMEYQLNHFIKGNAFERGDLNAFRGDFKDVGQITNIRVRSDNAYAASGWFLDYIDIYVNGKNFHFGVNSWVEKPNLVKLLAYNPNASEIVNYSLKVKTGDVSGAGTDSNIYVTLYGDKGTTTETRLNGYISGNAFERNDLNSLILHLPDVGNIKKIRVRSDDKWAGSGWFLSYIDVSAPGKTYRFNCSSWIEDGKLVRELTPAN